MEKGRGRTEAGGCGRIRRFAGRRRARRGGHRRRRRPVTAPPVNSSWLLTFLLAADLFPRGLAPIDAAAPAKLRVAACVGCHADVHADWAVSRHGVAWTNAIFQREYQDRKLDWCVHCHAPL